MGMQSLQLDRRRLLQPERATAVTATLPEFVATYDYTDENGELLFQVVRKVGKKFVQRRPNGSGGWIWERRTSAGSPTG